MTPNLVALLYLFRGLDLTGVVLEHALDPAEVLGGRLLPAGFAHASGIDRRLLDFVYREGFEYLETMPMSAIADLALRYLTLDIERRKLIDEVTSSQLPDRNRLAEILGEAGILSTLE